MASNDTVLCTVDPRGVASVTLNRPRVNNAYNGELIDALIDIFDRVGPRAAGRLALTGERFDAAMARAIGLVHETCPAAELEAVGARFVDHLLLAGPEAVAITKKLIAEAVETPFAGPFHDRIVAEAASRRRSPEAAEGLAGFREKRRPSWYPGE